MRHGTQRILMLACCAAAPALAHHQGANHAIDMQGFLRVSLQAADYREARLLTEREFIRRSREPGVVVLDARSAEKFAQLHVRGAINLPFPDIAVERLRQVIPDPQTQILILGPQLDPATSALEFESTQQ